VAEVVKLKLVEEPGLPSYKQQLLERFDSDMKRMREYLEHCENGGFALVAYDLRLEDGKPTLSSMANTFTTNPADGYWLPEMVKTRVYQRIHED
jgi:hypothetical protein